MIVSSPVAPGQAQYRPDIDGLRAVAILTVLFFHLGVSGFSGGYIGVDVFFVISGYLITKLIRDEVSATGTFSFPNFYIRRIRRLFPSMVFTLCLSLVAAAFLFSAQFFERFGASLLHALFSLSNFYFLKNSDYFAPAAELEPLLHTWSLSVEEQFYLLWPVTLVFLLKKSRGFRFGIFLILFAISLALTRYYIHQTSMIFYLLPFRVFEFIIGALMVWIMDGKSSSNWIDECITAIGLILIFFAATTYTSAEPFPSFNALIPCVGTALVIYGGKARYLGKLLTNRLCVSLGLISYSLYLIHWPLIAFYKYYMDVEILGSTEMIVLGTMAVLSAWLMFKYVERPFRKPRDVRAPSGRFLAGNAAMIMVIASVSIYAQVSDGAKWRAGEKAEYKHKDYAGQNFEWSERLGRRDAPVALVVYGDSHSKQYLPAFDKLARKNDIAIEYLGHPACLSLPSLTNVYLGTSHQSCIDMLSKLKAKAEGNRAPILLAYRYTKTITDLKTGRIVSHKDEEPYIKMLLESLDELKTELGENRTLILMGGVPGANSKLGHMDCITRPLTRQVCHVQYPLQQAEFTNLRNAFREFVAKSQGFTFLDPYEALCDANNCHVVKDGELYYSDHAHLTVSGADLVVNHFVPELMRIVHASRGEEASDGY